MRLSVWDYSLMRYFYFTKCVIINQIPDKALQLLPLHLRLSAGVLALVMANPTFNYQFRFILIGDSTVGKSSMLQYFYEGKLSSTLEPTVGVDFFSRNILLSDGTVVKLRLWDTAGQEKFK